MFQDAESPNARLYARFVAKTLALTIGTIGYGCLAVALIGPPVVFVVRQFVGCFVGLLLCVAGMCWSMIASGMAWTETSEYEEEDHHRSTLLWSRFKQNSSVALAVLFVDGVVTAFAEPCLLQFSCVDNLATLASLSLWFVLIASSVRIIRAAVKRRRRAIYRAQARTQARSLAALTPARESIPQGDATVIAAEPGNEIQWAHSPQMDPFRQLLVGPFGLNPVSQSCPALPGPQHQTIDGHAMNHDAIDHVAVHHAAVHLIADPAIEGYSNELG